MLSCSKAMKLGTVTVPLSLPALASIYPLQFMCQMLNPQDNSVGRPHMYGVTRSGLWFCGQMEVLSWWWGLTIARVGFCFPPWDDVLGPQEMLTPCYFTCLPPELRELQSEPCRSLVSCCNNTKHTKSLQSLKFIEGWSETGFPEES